MAEANSINSSSAGIVTNTGTAFSSSTVTQHGVLVGGASNAVASTSVGSTGQVLQANTGADPTYSTATYPSTAGTSGNILTSDGTNWNSTAASGAAGGLRFIQSKTASNSATLDFTTGFNYSAYYVVFSNIAPATAGALFNMRYSTNGGSTYLATGYFSGNNSSLYNTTTMGNNNSTTGILLTPDISNVAGSTGNGHVTINQISSGNPVAVGQSAYFSNAGSNWGWGSFFGMNSSATTVNALRFLFSTGNISSGVVTLYGLAQS